LSGPFGPQLGGGAAGADEGGVARRGRGQGGPGATPLALGRRVFGEVEEKIGRAAGRGKCGFKRPGAVVTPGVRAGRLRPKKKTLRQGRRGRFIKVGF